MKQNCWEFMKCGREFGGKKSHEFGVCPVATEEKANGINSGKNGGRICWAISGTMCGGTIQGEFAQKQSTCLACKVYRQIQKEEGNNFHLMLPGQTYNTAERKKK